MVWYYPFPKPRDILASELARLLGGFYFGINFRGVANNHLLSLTNPEPSAPITVERGTNPGGDPIFTLSNLEPGDLGAIVVSAIDETSSMLWIQPPSAATDRPLTENEQWDIHRTGLRSREERRQLMLAIYGPIRRATSEENERRLHWQDVIVRKLVEDLGSVFGASGAPSTTEPGGVGGAEPPSGLMRALPKLPARLRETEADPTVLAEDQRSSAPVSCETWLIATRTYFNGLKDGEEVSLERFANMTFWSHSRVKHLSAEHHTCCFEWKVAKVKRQVPT